MFIHPISLRFDLGVTGKRAVRANKGPRRLLYILARLVIGELWFYVTIRCHLQSSLHP